MMTDRIIMVIMNGVAGRMGYRQPEVIATMARRYIELVEPYTRRDPTPDSAEHPAG